MFKGVFEYAGIVVEVNSMFEYFQKMSKKYKSTNEPVFSITITQDDIEFERSRSTGDYSINNQVLDYPDFYLETLAIYRKFLDYAWKENVMLFHCSTFSIDGIAFILTAPSGTGKSTHARFLRSVYKNRFSVINDDKPLIKYDGLDFWMYGTPWNGKHGLDNNTRAKLKGIFVLYQNKENVIEKLNSSNSFNHIYRQAYKPIGKDATSATLKMIIRMSNDIPCYFFGCTNSIEAAKVSGKIIDEILNNNK